jgi:O-methyltransferase domain
LAIEILRTFRAALADAGRLLVIERGIGPGNEPDRAMFSDLVMLGGRERTAEDFERLCTEAGFRMTSIVPTGSPPFNIIEGDPV